MEASIFDVIAGLTLTLSKGEGIIIFPNPVYEKLVIDGITLTGTSVEISIYNMLGEEVFAPLSLGEGPGGEADVSSFPSGMYWLEINSNEKIFRAKFIKSGHQ